MMDVREVPIILMKLKERLDNEDERNALQEAIECYERQILEIPYDFFGKVNDSSVN